jgi:DNA-binding beta-propeller fold protein YncE
VIVTFRSKTLLRIIAAAVLLIVSGPARHTPENLFAEFGAAYAQDPAPRGADIIPLRQVFDPYPVFNGIAIDPENNIVAMTDVNRKSLLSYDRVAGSNALEITPPDITQPRRQIFGPLTNIGFAAGLLLDSPHKEILAINNDIEDTMIVLPYGAQGNASPKRILSIPHQSWGVALSRTRDEIAISVEIQQAVVIYRRDARDVQPPVRSIRGPDTGLADPHGVFWDDRHNEIGVANHGNFRGVMKDTGAGCEPGDGAEVEAGEIQPPSVTIYRADTRGDAKPLRKIQGDRTRLDFPMGLSVDAERDEFAVANNGGNSVLVFSRTMDGNVAPVRVLSGGKTGINRPVGVAFDTVHDELWVSNFADHSALVFDRRANGNVAPKRVIRTAPQGTPSPGFGNPQALAYDSKRQQILVPN